MSTGPGEPINGLKPMVRTCRDPEKGRGGRFPTAILVGPALEMTTPNKLGKDLECQVGHRGQTDTFLSYVLRCVFLADILKFLFIFMLEAKHVTGDRERLWEQRRSILKRYTYPVA